MKFVKYILLLLVITTIPFIVDASRRDTCRELFDRGDTNTPQWGRGNCSQFDFGGSSSSNDGDSSFTGEGGSAGTFTGLSDEGCGRYSKGGFLWKPVSESNGDLVVLIPSAYTGHTKRDTNRIVGESGRTIETGHAKAFNGHNGNREHYSFNEPGAAYPKNIYFAIDLKSGGTAKWRIENDFTYGGGRGCIGAEKPTELYIEELKEKTQKEMDAIADDLNQNVDSAFESLGLNSGSSVCGVASEQYYSSYPSGTSLCSSGMPSTMTQVASKIISDTDATTLRNRFNSYNNSIPQGSHGWFCLPDFVNSMDNAALNNNITEANFCRSLTEDEYQNTFTLQSTLPMEYIYEDDVYSLIGYLVIPDCYSYDVDVRNTSGNDFRLNIDLDRQSSGSCERFVTEEFEEEIEYDGNIDLKAYINDTEVRLELFDRTRNTSSTQYSGGEDVEIPYGDDGLYTDPDYNYDVYQREDYNNDNNVRTNETNRSEDLDEDAIETILNLLVASGVISSDMISQLEAILNINITATPQPSFVPVNTTPTIQTTNTRPSTLLGSRNNNTTTFAGFNRNLTVGSQGEDVRRLQQYLNNNGYTIASSGAGSPGNETTYFGPATQSALARFQQDNDILPASGYLGPLTRDLLK